MTAFALSTATVQLPVKPGDGCVTIGVEGAVKSITAKVALA